MISTIVKKETLRDVEAGAGALTFDAKPHWRKRLTPWHRSIMLLSGGRCRVYKVERIEDGGGALQGYSRRPLHLAAPGKAV